MNLNEANDYKIPDWENQFINIIERMRTIPYVLLGHFQFINVDWIDESDEEEDESSMIDLRQIEEKPANHWNLIKKMIFSKGSIASDGRKQVDQSKSEKGQTKIKIETNYSQKIGQLNDIYNQFVDFIRSKKKPKRLSKESQESNSELSNRKKRRLKALNLKKEASKKLKDNSLVDLDELAKKISHHKLNSVMSKDDGPFVTDYRFLLGIEFWANFCGVDKNELISACAQNLWSNELESFRSFNLTNSNRRSSAKTNKRSNKIVYLKQLKQFLKGTKRPAKAPQRVISPEEKFKLIPYSKLYNPNTDLKKTFYLNTIRDQLTKLYLLVVHLIGGDQYPLKRNVGYEEAYEDLLLWVLDTFQAKTRFIALLNDQINWEIN